MRTIEACRLFAKFCALVLIRYVVAAKYWILGPYYRGLAVQAEYLYRTSDFFRFRWEALGYDYAVESFRDGETGYLFFKKAQREHWYIRWNIFLDATLGRTPRPYWMKEEE